MQVHQSDRKREKEKQEGKREKGKNTRETRYTHNKKQQTDSEKKPSGTQPDGFAYITETGLPENTEEEVEPCGNLCTERQEKRRYRHGCDKRDYQVSKVGALV